MAAVDSPLQETESVQDKINGRLYRRGDLVREYAMQTLLPPEATALVRHQNDIIGRRALDLGCGAGRIAAFLRPFTDDYVGLDVPPHMVEYCREHYEGLCFCQCDMRNLSQFVDGSFDTVFAVSNLFDAVSHADRLRTLAEVRRVLATNGLLIFSTHNRNIASLGKGPRLKLNHNPLRQLRNVVQYVRSRANHLRIRAHQVAEGDYALVNDSGHNYAVLHYYIRRDAQAKQLAGTGFRLLECLDEKGLTLGPDDDDHAFCTLQIRCQGGRIARLRRSEER